MTNSSITSFEEFASIYDNQMGINGDYIHYNLIDPALFSLVGNLDNKVVYDIGCGNGYLDSKLIISGARKVFASDISPTLIQLAKTNFGSYAEIDFFVSDATDFSYIEDNTVDLIVMNMSIHYIKDVNLLAKGISKTLKNNGEFVFSTSHPFHSMRLFKKDVSIEKVKYIAEQYLTNFERKADWQGGYEFTIYKYPISTYINIFAQYGLYVTGMVETQTDKIDAKGNIIQSTIPGYYILKFKKCNDT